MNQQKNAGHKLQLWGALKVPGILDQASIADNQLLLIKVQASLFIINPKTPEVNK